MKIEEQVSFSQLTTLRLGGVARFVLTCESEAEVREAIAFAKDKTLPFFIMGSGSNVLPHDEGYDGVVILLSLNELSFTAEEAEVVVIAGASVSWDALVGECTKRLLWGIENLAGIPGMVGAAPVQNIGAYGVEISETVFFVEALDTTTGEVKRFTKEECEFGYRDSIFKREPRFVILRVALRLRTTGVPTLSYKDIAMYAAESPLQTPEEVAFAVRHIRSRKFPDLATHGTAGSFFKNPVIPQAMFDALKQRYPLLPGFPVGDAVKIPLAWILDQVLSLRGFRKGKVWLFDTQPLVLVADKGATAQEVEALAKEVETRVQKATGIVIEREVRSVPQ